jgi:hypothetical protein
MRNEHPPRANQCRDGYVDLANRQFGFSPIAAGWTQPPGLRSIRSGFSSTLCVASSFHRWQGGPSRGYALFEDSDFFTALEALRDLHQLPFICGQLTTLTTSDYTKE